MTQSVRVMLVDDGLWHVKRGAGRKVDLAFHRQLCALAFARALAYRSGTNLYLHRSDGSVVRQPKSSLSYSRALDD